MHEICSRLSILGHYIDIHCAFQISSYASQIYLFYPNISHSGTHLPVLYILVFIQLP